MSTDESPNDDLVSRLERVFPYYLTAGDRKILHEHLRSFPDDSHYFATGWEGPPEPIQGDGWNGFTKIDFNTNTRSMIAGLVVSNSCDIDVANEALRHRNVAFAPIIPLSAYESRLRNRANVASAGIAAHLDSIRNQRKSEIFYLPASSSTPETIVLFDDIASQPLGNFGQTRERRKLFRLNNYGFYIFLMKLSIHFTRFGEELNRGD